MGTTTFVQAAKEYAKAREDLRSAQSSAEHAQACLTSAEQRLLRAKSAVYDDKWLDDSTTPARTALVGTQVVTLRRGAGNALTLDVTDAEQVRS
jgi:hypothetical protein